MDKHSPLHLGVVAMEKGAFGSLSTNVAIFTLLLLIIFANVLSLLIYIYIIFTYVLFLYIYIYIYIYIPYDHSVIRVGTVANHRYR